MYHILGPDEGIIDKGGKKSDLLNLLMHNYKLLYVLTKDIVKHV